MKSSADYKPEPLTPATKLVAGRQYEISSELRAHLLDLHGVAPELVVECLDVRGPTSAPIVPEWARSEGGERIMVGYQLDPHWSPDPLFKGAGRFATGLKKFSLNWQAVQDCAARKQFAREARHDAEKLLKASKARGEKKIRKAGKPAKAPAREIDLSVLEEFMGTSSFEIPDEEST